MTKTQTIILIIWTIILIGLAMLCNPRYEGFVLDSLLFLFLCFLPTAAFLSYLFYNQRRP